jgi:hypothetical protein
MKAGNLLFRINIKKLIASSLLLVLNVPLAMASLSNSINATVQGSNLIKDNQSSIVRINWAGTSRATQTNSPGQSYQVYSDHASFLVNGNVVATSSQRISTSLISGTVNPFTIRENLHIPLSVLKTAQLADSKLIVYSREFFEEGSTPTLTAQVNLQVVASGSGTLNLTAIDLRFEDGGMSKVAGIGQAIRATAGVNHSGSGMLDLVWEIATPATTSGSAVFTTLKTVRRFLTAGRYSLIESPLLPTQLSGNYLLRLRIKSPAQNTDELLLHYSVIPNNINTIEMKPIYPLQPLSNTRFDQNTEFSWQPVQGASSYQIEFLVDSSASPSEQDPQAMRATGLLLPSSRNTTQLSAIALQHLKPDHAYYWRILALDKDGRLFAKSEARKLWFGAIK